MNTNNFHRVNIGFLMSFMLIVLLYSCCIKLPVVNVSQEKLSGTHQVIHLELMNRKAIDSIGNSVFVLKLTDGYDTLDYASIIKASLKKANNVVVNGMPKKSNKFPFIIYPVNAYGYEDPLIYVSWNYLSDTSQNNIQHVQAWLLSIGDSWRQHDYLEFNTKYTIEKIGWIPN